MERIDRSILTGRERHFGNEDIIVSKTDAKGKILYANRTFLEISGFTEEELIGAPHSIIRHPDMPRCVFRFVWETIRNGDEIFAYVKNRAKNGDHYWVFAHLTPTIRAGEIVGYHSSRRCPPERAVVAAESVYRVLAEEERRHSNSNDGIAAGLSLFHSHLAKKGMDYGQFVFSL